MILAMIQARNGSSRLPGKVSMELGGKTVIEQVVDRVLESEKIDECVVVTTIEKQDLSLLGLCARKGVRVFAGSEDDVLDRFYQCAKLFSPHAVVRITGDCPVIDSEVIDKVIGRFEEEGADYTSNCVPPTYPDGLDVEVFTFDALRKAWELAELKSEREHVTPYIRNSGSFSLMNVENDKDLSGLRWTLDEIEDYNFLKAVYDELYKENPRFKMKDILALLERKSDLGSLNSQFERNEGYIKSLKKDNQ